LLKETIVDVRHTAIAVSVKRNADQKLARRYTGIEKCPHAGIHIEARCRISLAAYNGALKFVVPGPSDSRRSSR